MILFVTMAQAEAPFTAFCSVEAAIVLPDQSVNLYMTKNEFSCVSLMVSPPIFYAPMLACSSARATLFNRWASLRFPVSTAARAAAMISSRCECEKFILLS